VEDRKIASIGVGVRRWISMHGFALNVARELPGFDSITPCGIQGVTMTSLTAECSRELDIESVAAITETVFLRVLVTLPAGCYS
jgi:lipoate-protein ligase B